MLFISLCGLLFPFPSDPDFHFASPVSDKGEVGGEDDEAERDHPEAEDGQEAQNPPDDQSPSQYQSSKLGFRLFELGSLHVVRNFEVSSRAFSIWLQKMASSRNGGCPELIQCLISFPVTKIKRGMI